MFCRNCGKELNENQDVCLNCGVAVEVKQKNDKSKNFCKNCGKELNENQDICLGCGVRTEKNNINAKSKLAAGLLGIFLGGLGIHNFYLGYIGKAVAQLLITVLSIGILAAVSWIWGLVEGIMILTGDIDKDADGNRLVD